MKLHNHSEKMSDANNYNIIKQPKVYFFVGIGGIIIFVAVALFFLVMPESMIANYEEGIR